LKQNNGFDNNETDFVGDDIIIFGIEAARPTQKSDPTLRRKIDDYLEQKNLERELRDIYSDYDD